MAPISQRRPLFYHLYTVWLFTWSDMKTIVIPSTIFGVVNALSGSVSTAQPMPSILDVGTRLPLTVLWAWVNLLPFSIDNQRQPKSIQEDLENKSWRPLPSMRLTPQQATSSMLMFYLVALLVSGYLGGVRQCISLMGMGYWYNDLKGADCSFITRNFINACGYVCFTSGALEVASDSTISLRKLSSHGWLLIIGLIIFTTIQLQDMQDQAGDSLRGRRTMPLVIGDSAARWTIAVPVGIWSWFCPVYWQLGIRCSMMPIILGLIITWRILSLRTVRADKVTFRTYNVWVVSLFLLPLFKRYSQT